MIYRMCPSKFQHCNCTDVEMQPCLYDLVGDYLDQLRKIVKSGERGDSEWLVIYKHDGDETELGCELVRIKGQIRQIHRTYPTFEDLYNTEGEIEDQKGKRS